MGNEKVTPAAATTFANVFIEYLELSADKLTPNMKQIANEAAADGQITLREFRDVSSIEDLFFILKRCDNVFYRSQPECRKPLTIFDIAPALQKLKCQLGIHPNPEICKPEVEVVSSPCHCDGPKESDYYSGDY